MFMGERSKKTHTRNRRGWLVFYGWPHWVEGPEADQITGWKQVHDTLRDVEEYVSWEEEGKLHNGVVVDTSWEFAFPGARANLGWRLLWTSSCPTPSSSRISYSRLPWIVPNWILTMSENTDSTKSLGKAVTTFISPCSKKLFFLCLNRICSISICVPIASYSFTGHHWKQSGSIFVISSHQVIIHMGKIPMSLLFYRPTHPSSLGLFSYNRYSSPLISFVALHRLIPVCPCLSCGALGHIIHLSENRVLIKILYQEERGWDQSSDSWNCSSSPVYASSDFKGLPAELW